MNKKLLAAAITAALAAPMAAQADVSVYGRASLSYDHVDSSGTTTTTIGDDRGNTRLGVRWSEDLGDGMKALGEFEFAPVDASSANTPKGQNFYQRQTWAGIKGGFGQIEIGTILQPYKYSGGVGYDAFVGTIAEARGNDGGMLSSHFGQGGYMGNAIAYRNKFGAVSFAIAYSPDEGGDGLYQGSKGDMNASLKFGFSGGEVGVAYSKNDNATGITGPEGEQNSKIFGKYSFGASTVLAQYETSSANGASVEGGAVGEDVKVMFLGYQFKMGMNTLAVQLGKTTYDGATDDRKYMALGGIHHFSKKTAAYIGYRTTKQDPSTDIKGYAIGLIESF